MEAACWKHCLDQLQRDIPQKEFDTWIRPLHAEWDEQELRLLAPNRFVLDRVNQDHLNRILDVWSGLTGEMEPRVLLGIGGRSLSSGETRAVEDERAHAARGQCPAHDRAGGSTTDDHDIEAASLPGSWLPRGSRAPGSRWASRAARR